MAKNHVEDLPQQTDRKSTGPSSSSYRFRAVSGHRKRRGGLLIATTTAALAICYSTSIGLVKRTGYDQQILVNRLLQLKTQYLAEGGVEYLAAYYHRFGPDAPVPGEPFGAPTVPNPLPITLGNSRVEWDLRHILKSRIKYDHSVPMGSGPMPITMAGPLVTFMGPGLPVMSNGGRISLIDPDRNGATRTFLINAVFPGNVVQFVSNNPDGLGPLQAGTKGQVTYHDISNVNYAAGTVTVPDASFASGGAEWGDVLALRDSNNGEALRLFTINQVLSETQVTLVSANPDGLGVLAPGNHSGIKVMEHRYTMAAGVSIRKNDPSNQLMARTDVKRSNSRLAGRSGNRIATGDLGILRPAHPTFAVGTLLFGGRNQVHILRFDLNRPTGSGVSERIPTLFNDNEPSLAPDGRKIVFSRAVGGRRQIFDMNLDGSGQRQLTNEPQSCVSPMLQPVTGRFLFFCVPQSDQIRYVAYPPPPGPIPPSTILVTQENPGQIRQNNSALSPDARVYQHDQLTISPDGNLMVFRARSGSTAGPHCLYVFKLDDDPNPFLPVNPAPVTGVNRAYRYTSLGYGVNGVREPAFSPDGRYVVFVNQRQGQGVRWIRGEVVRMPIRNEAKPAQIASNSSFPSRSLDDQPDSDNPSSDPPNLPTLTRLTDDIYRDRAPRYMSHGVFADEEPRIAVMSRVGTWEIRSISPYSRTNPAWTEVGMTSNLGLVAGIWNWSPDE